MLGMLAIAGTGYGLIGLLVIILLIVLIVYFALSLADPTREDATRGYLRFTNNSIPLCRFVGAHCHVGSFRYWWRHFLRRHGHGWKC